MSDSHTLINAFDTYGDFDVEMYFTVKYNRIATNLEIDLPLKPQKEIMDRVLGELELEESEFKTIYKTWRVAAQSDVKAGDDYVKYAFLSSETRGICVEIQTYPESVSVEFFYDEQENGLEEWVFTQVNKLRKRFGKPAKPVFRVLTKKSDGFGTKTVDINRTDTNLEANYNDSLLEVDEIIGQAIEEEASGLVLLHGVPGTGKTSYIKTLLTRYKDEKFIFIPNDFVEEMLKPDFITFLITRKNSILVIEDAESVIMSRDHSNGKSVVSTILQITDGLFSDYLNIKVICTFNTDVSKIDKALFRKGRMIAFYKFEELTEEKAMALIKADSPSDLPETLTLAELYNHKARSFAEAATGKRIGFGKRP